MEKIKIEYCSYTYEELEMADKIGVSGSEITIVGTNNEVDERMLDTYKSYKGLDDVDDHYLDTELLMEEAYKITDEEFYTFEQLIKEYDLSEVEGYVDLGAERE